MIGQVIDSNGDGRISFGEFVDCLRRGQEGVSPIFQMLVPTAGVGGAGAGAAAGGGAGGAHGDVQEPPNKRSK